jgi:hypothetical protein
MSFLLHSDLGQDSKCWEDGFESAPASTPTPSAAVATTTSNLAALSSAVAGALANSLSHNLPAVGLL